MPAAKRFKVFLPLGQFLERTLAATAPVPQRHGTGDHRPPFPSSGGPSLNWHAAPRMKLHSRTLSARCEQGIGRLHASGGACISMNSILPDVMTHKAISIAKPAKANRHPQNPFPGRGQAPSAARQKSQAPPVIGESQGSRTSRCLSDQTKSALQSLTTAFYSTKL